MKAQAEQAGLADAVIFNSCAVTAEAERQVRQAIRKLRKEQPGKRIIVTGCSAQVHPEDYANMEEVDHVVGNHDKMQAATYLNLAVDASERVIVNDIMSVKETASHLVSGFEGRARAFVQVQNGCNHRCTFCIIPYGRGNSRSVALGDIVAQVRALVEAGYKEVVMTGVDISDYGSDLPGSPNLGQMMKRLLALVPELPRLRLSSIDAVEVDDDLYDIIASEPRFMPHLHISLQAGDDMVLKRMKRRHLRQDALDFCARVRTLRPDVVFGADIIAGFPTETDEMFENTRRMVEEADLIYLHVFPYSARSGTPAAKMPQVAKQVRKDRAAALREAGNRQLARYLNGRVGEKIEVLMEKPSEGRCTHFVPVKMEGEHESGAIVPAVITGVAGQAFTARVRA